MKKIFKWLFIAMLTAKLCYPSAGINIKEIPFGGVSPEFPELEENLKLNESFERWPPPGWTFASPDGGTGWFWYTIDKYPLFGGATGAAAASNSSGGPLYNEQWLISPPVTITEGDKLSFWMMVVNSLFYGEKVDVMISAAGNKTDDC